MIPTTATDAEFRTYVENIKNKFNSARPDQAAKGRAWYPVAHDLAIMLGDDDVRKGAGIIAALSANKRWSENVRLATDAASGNVHGHVGNALDKVRAIMAGAAPEDVLPMTAKTGNFYRNIVDPSDPNAVTIDRHAHDIAVGEVYGNDDRGLSNPNRYATLARAYMVAAEELGETSSVTQAITWTAQVEMLSGKGTRGQRSM
jgi:hypothetical protein